MKYLVALALLQGPAATALIVGNILYIARRFPTHLVATANGVNAVLVGVCAASVTFLGGYLWDALKARAYLPMAGLATLALVIFVFSARRQHRAPMVDPGTVPSQLQST
jgi:hypothetical protein